MLPTEENPTLFMHHADVSFVDICLFVWIWYGVCNDVFGMRMSTIQNQYKFKTHEDEVNWNYKIFFCEDIKQNEVGYSKIYCYFICTSPINMRGLGYKHCFSVCKRE